MINNCNHIFNPDAIKHWFKSNHTCPLCRSNLIENTNTNTNTKYKIQRIRIINENENEIEIEIANSMFCR